MMIEQIYAKMYDTDGTHDIEHLQKVFEQYLKAHEFP
jgi:hypothetical protein